MLRDTDVFVLSEAKVIASSSLLNTTEFAFVLKLNVRLVVTNLFGLLDWSLSPVMETV